MPSRLSVVACAVLIVTAGCVTPGQTSGSKTSGDPNIDAVRKSAAAVQVGGPMTRDDELRFFVGVAGLRTALGSRADEITDLIERSRESAVAKIARPAFTGFGNKQPAELTPIYLMFLMFAKEMASALDAATSGAGGSTERTAPPFTSTDSGPTTTAVSTLTTTESVSGAGSVATMKWHWIYRTSVTDNTTHAPVAELVEDRTMTSSFNVCPDAAGAVPASLDVVAIRGATVASGGVVTQTQEQTHRTNTFTGKVDDKAVLTTVEQQAHVESSFHRTSSGAASDGSIDFALGMTWQVNNGQLGDATSTSAATGTGTGDATGDDVRTAAGALGLDVGSYQEVFQSGQTLWRNGRCVVVTAPDYSAETPVRLAEQSTIQHHEDVQPSSETKFQIGVRHRFAGSLNQSVQTQLASGDKKLEPNQFESVPGSEKYTAPDETDKKATVKLESTSKRGIGTLLLEFRTIAKKLLLKVSGTVVNLAPEVARFTATVGIGEAEFRKVDDTTWEGTGALNTTIKAESLTPDSYLPCSTGSETGSVLFTARIDKRGDTSVWVVHPDIGRSRILLGDLCGAAPGTAGGAGYTINFLLQLGDITIPIDGGTVPVHSSRSLGPSTLTVDATVVGTVPRS
jgi:hypothetical protein